MPQARKRGNRITWAYKTKTAANKNAKDLKRYKAKDVKVETEKDKLGRTYYVLSAKL